MVVQLTHLDVRYPGQVQAAVNHVSLSLEAGQIGVLIGPSGCGKTTVLRAIAGLEPVSGGRINLAGRTVSSQEHRTPPESRKVGMVFQDYALFPHMTIKDNVRFGLHGWADDLQRARVQEVLKWVALSDSESKYPHELSGGQQQRVALARALAPKPDVLLLDEPFSNLDVDLRERLALEVRDLLKAANTTALFVTHDQAEAFAMGDKVGVMNEGSLHQWASPYELYHAPASRFVASFIGEGVFVPGTRLVTDPDQIQTELGLLGPTVKPQSTDTTQSGSGTCELLIRADDVLVTDQAPTHQAVLVNKIFRGSNFLYTLQLPTGTQLLAMVPSHQHHPIGSTIGLTFQLDHLITFPTP